MTKYYMFCTFMFILSMRFLIKGVHIWTLEVLFFHFTTLKSQMAMFHVLQWNGYPVRPCVFRPVTCFNSLNLHISSKAHLPAGLRTGPLHSVC